MNRVQQLITYNFDRYVDLGGFTSIKKAIDHGAEFVISELRTSGIKGRGGAAYPTWKKYIGK